MTNKIDSNFNFSWQINLDEQWHKLFVKVVLWTFCMHCSPLPTVLLGNFCNNISYIFNFKTYAIKVTLLPPLAQSTDSSRMISVYSGTGPNIASFSGLKWCKVLQFATADSAKNSTFWSTFSAFRHSSRDLLMKVSWFHSISNASVFPSTSCPKSRLWCLSATLLVV